MQTCWLYINLDAAKDRLRHIEAQLAALGLAAMRVPAIDGGALSLDHPCIDVERFWHDAGMRVRSTDAACYLSHLRAMETFLATDASFAVILEDDVSLGADLPAIVERLTAAGAPDDWDMVKMTGNNRLRALSFRAIDGVHRLGVPFTRLPGAAAYLVNRHAARRYIDRMLPMTVLFDHAFDRGWALGVRTRVVAPLPANGRTSDHARRSTIDTPDRPRVKKTGLGKATTLWWRAKTEVMRVIFTGYSYLWPRRPLGRHPAR